LQRLGKEIEANFRRFCSTWRADIQSVTSSLDSAESVFRTSYFRLVSIQAWRSELLEHVLPADALAFFVEAQNDAVVSHLLAHLGCWRPALQALRSLIENAMRAVCYMDHPVELRLWHTHKHTLGFAELVKYLLSHPDVSHAGLVKHAVADIKKEYQTLSLAVHASAKSFRMTSDQDTTVLFCDDSVPLRRWSTHEKHVLSGLNLLLISLFSKELQGAKLRNLRKAVSFAVPTSKHPHVLRQLKVRLLRASQPAP